jgi:hypothetical protein
MSVIVQGGTSGVKADVDANKNLLVNTPTSVLQTGHVAIAAEADPGTIAMGPTGLLGRQIKDLDVSQDYRLRVGIDTALFYEDFQGSQINVQLWTYPSTTATFAIGGGVVSFNSGNSVAASAVTRLSSWRTFPFYQTFMTYFETRILITSMQSNNVSEFGFGYAATTAAPTDGAFFRYDATGNFRCVISFNGTETVATPGSMPTINQYHHYVVGVGQDFTEFWVDNVLYAVIPTPAQQPSPTSAASEPIFIRNYNTAAGAGGAAQLKVSQAMVTLGDAQTNKPWSHIQAGMGLNCFQAPTNIAAVSTQLIANSAAPAAIAGANATCTNAVTTMAGDFRMNAQVAGEVDCIMFGYLNVQGTAAITGRNLYITGCRISSINYGAVVTTTCTTIQWSLGFGSTALTLATTDAATTRAPRRIGLGFQYFPVTTGVIGYPANADIDTQFTTPYLVEPGCYVHVICKFVVGTATASQTIRGTINLNGYWE